MECRKSFLTNTPVKNDAAQASKRNRSSEEIQYKQPNKISCVSKSGALNVNSEIDKLHEPCLDRVTKKSFSNGKPILLAFFSGENSSNDSKTVPGSNCNQLDLLSRVLAAPNFPPPRHPLHMRFDAAFFHEENLESFKNFLTTGRALSTVVHLTIVVPEDGGSMPLTFNGITVSLTKLSALVLQFPTKNKDIQATGVNPLTSNFVGFFQLLLNGAPVLTELEFKCGRPPRKIGDLVLPPTLTRLTIGCEMNNEEWEGLIKNDLPVLHTLYLFITNSSIPEHLLTRIIDKFSCSIKKLGFLGNGLINNPKESSFFRFSNILQRLEYFQTNSIHAELADGQTDLQTKIPNVKTLCLGQQTINMLHKWTKGSCYKSVKELYLSLAREDCVYQSPEFAVTVKEAEMKMVNNAFPNLSSIRLTVSCHDKSGLQYLFEKMSQLKHLEIRVKNRERFKTPFHWDFLLIGANPMTPSIKCLKSLISLSLWTESTRDQTSIVSVDVFDLAFYLMPNLKELKMAGSFMVAPQYIEGWKKKGGSITYTS